MKTKPKTSKRECFSQGGTVGYLDTIIPHQAGTGPWGSMLSVSNFQSETWSCSLTVGKALNGAEVTGKNNVFGMAILDLFQSSSVSSEEFFPGPSAAAETRMKPSKTLTYLVFNRLIFNVCLFVCFWLMLFGLSCVLRR